MAVSDIDHLGSVISHATAPAFMLGAVAAFLSILIQRMERISDRIRALRGTFQLGLILRTRCCRRSSAG